MIDRNKIVSLSTMFRSYMLDFCIPNAPPQMIQYPQRVMWICIPLWCHSYCPPKISHTNLIPP